MEPIHPYLDTRGREERVAGGARLVPIQTPQGPYRVWVKRVGNNPRLRLLLLHGGPGATHTYLEAVDSYLPAAGIEYYHYDQLGAGRSDRPSDIGFAELDRFVDEVEQVRRALDLDRDDFVLFGHSWGGILAIEYALRYQEHLKGLVISNMMASVPRYNAYAEQVLMPAMDQAALAEVKALEAAGATEDPRYMELLIPLHYERHVLRRPYAQWPEPVVRGFAEINPEVYVRMQGPSELGISPTATLATWDRFEDLARIEVPTLVIGARYDTMDPKHLAAMAERLPRGCFHRCEQGSHLAMYDDAESYFEGLIGFLHELEAGSPKGDPAR
jgi:proline iminopeptidase